jgi:hypothetical protein
MGFSGTTGDVAAREARAADAFVALRPNGAQEESLAGGEVDCMRKTSFRRTLSRSSTATLPSGYRSTTQLLSWVPSSQAIILANVGLAVPVKIANSLITSLCHA